MKKLVWFVLGIAGGFVLAHLIDKDPRGHEVMADLDARVSEFTDRIGDAYREQEARLTEVVDAATSAAVSAVSAATPAAATPAAD
ncbi:MULTISPECIES: ATPase [unclassified Microbacterium]|uniref:ATPase n=1 Tax=unclassified Microbacterium TaxID=2609290 RepID=UPI00214C0B12|nr:MULTISPECIES: ATPase [unclassified Microbacterium]MCR2785674.1 ATPase [Microbacterium sp. zg.B96]MDL5350209.1 ATPase [Microbacterium sp. zg-YB36]WIM17341.1 ATPase [Microbacterium sp. zg-B96]